MSSTTFIDLVNAWLDTPNEERDFERGATLMLQGNRNRILHQNVTRKKDMAKVVYELRKIAGRKKEAVVLEMQPFSIEKVEERISTAEGKSTGKRADHDQLPVQVQAIFEINLTNYHKMRALFEELKVKSSDELDFTAEDRAELLKEFDRLADATTTNWEMYDNFKMGDTLPGVGVDPKPKQIDVKRVQANRTLLSRAAQKETINEKHVKEVQVRYDELISNGHAIDAELCAKLEKLGVVLHA